jgi:hypothetical protein
MSFFGSLIGTVSKIATTAYAIIKTALPILQALRPAVDEVDEAFKYVEAKIAGGGVAADDFLDRNIEAIKAIEHATGKGVVVMGQLNALAEKLYLFSQIETPDEITPEEAEELGKDMLELRSALNGWKPTIDDAVTKMTAME